MNKTIVTIGALALVGIGGYFAWKKFGKKDEGANMSDDELKSAVATSEDDETPSSKEDAENEVDLDAEKKADEIEEANDLAEEESDMADESLEPSKKEERAKRRAERKQRRSERKNARKDKRAKRRTESKEKRSANKDKRKKAAKITIGVAIPIVGAGMLVGKGIKKIQENKEKRQEKRAERKAKRKERRGRRRFDGMEFYGEDFSVSGELKRPYARKKVGKGCPMVKQFGNEDSDFAFNGIDF